MDEISRSLNFTYNVHEVADHRYGQPVGDTGSWNGMMGEVIRGDADMTVADLTITAMREKAVDFTHPFMNLGLSVVIKKSRTRLHIGSLEDVAFNPNIKVGAVRGGSTQSYLRHSKKALHEQLHRNMVRDDTMTRSNQCFHLGITQYGVHESEEL